MSFFENTRKPVGLSGKIMVAMMNLGHSPVARWGLRFLELTPDARVLDCGCGGGANIKRLLKKCPEGIVKGIDYKVFGEGTVTKIDKAQKHIRVTFGIGEKTFIFPDAFKQGFLKMKGE